MALLATFLLLLASAFPASGADNLPPIAQIVSPTNHTEFRWGDGVGRFLVGVHVSDPEAAIDRVQIEVNDQIVITNRLGDYEVDFGFIQPESGEIKLTVTDDQGLIVTDIITFTAVQLPWFPNVLLQIFPQGDRLVISASHAGPGFLQESSDWLKWSDVARLDTNEFVITPNASRRFYRIRFE
jgi:hypothetical protein